LQFHILWSAPSGSLELFDPGIDVLTFRSLLTRSRSQQIFRIITPSAMIGSRSSGLGFDGNNRACCLIQHRLECGAAFWAELIEVAQFYA
jgi:hypothetical protein